MSNVSITLSEAKKKLEHYCAYQERCHEDVTQKIWEICMSCFDKDEIIAHLITHGFLNEERFACSFARGKHRIKQWGNVRIVNELKSRNISQRNINSALKKIAEEYEETFEQLAVRQWESLNEKDPLKKRKKYCDFLLRKGFESNLVYKKVKELENI